MKILVSLFILNLIIVGCGVGDSKSGRDAAQTSDDSPVHRNEGTKDPRSNLPKIAGIPLAEVNVIAELSKSDDSFLFTNHSPGSVWYDGYGVNSPIYGLEGREDPSDKNEEWLSLLGWCGTGLEEVELKEGESLEVAPHTSDIGEEIKAIRVSIYFSGSPNEAGVEVFGPEIAIPNKN